MVDVPASRVILVRDISKVLHEEVLLLISKIEEPRYNALAEETFEE